MTSSKLSTILYSQWLLLKPAVRAYGSILLSYWILAFFGLYSMEIAVSIGQIVIILSPLALFARENSSGFQEYLLLLPKGRFGLVTGRYLFAMFVVSLSTLITFTFLVFWQVMTKNNTLSVILALLLSTSVALLFLEIALPLLYKMGVKQGKPWFFLLVLTPIALLVLFLPEFEPTLLSFIEKEGEIKTLSYFILLVTASLTGLFPSYVVSMKIYEKKSL